MKDLCDVEKANDIAFFVTDGLQHIEISDTELINNSNKILPNA
jgi:hypothetical protein